MITKTLHCHPETLCPSIQSIHVDIEQLQEPCLRLRYHVNGILTQLLIPEAEQATACDGLSEHTCFEVFIAVPGESRYHEFNFSPSGQWAAYAFDSYRSRCKHDFQPLPRSQINYNTNHLLLEAVLPLANLPGNRTGKLYRLGLSTVIETRDGQHSYWALRHPCTKPDFHHESGFTCILNSQ